MSACIPANGDANAGAASTTSSTDLGLKGRDLITIGIFTALYFALTMIPMFVSGIHPMVWAFFPAMAAILGSVPFMLLCSRVRKPFAILIMGSVMCLITITGSFTPLIVGLFVGGALLAELARYLTHYERYLGNAVAFAFFSLGWLGSPLPIWLFHDAFAAHIAQAGMPAEYVAQLASVSDPIWMAACIGATVVCACLGSLLTRALFRKHFERAGLV